MEDFTIIPKEVKNSQVPPIRLKKKALPVRLERFFLSIPGGMANLSSRGREGRYFDLRKEPQLIIEDLTRSQNLKNF